MKLQWSLMLWEELSEALKVLMHGAKKHGNLHYREVSREEHLDAIFRHLIEYNTGNKIDKETACSALAHVMDRCMFVMWHDNHDKAA